MYFQLDVKYHKNYKIILLSDSQKLNEVSQPHNGSNVYNLDSQSTLYTYSHCHLKRDNKYGF